ncbi:MAG: DUF2865 domain-containing protein [Rhizobiaceae bacterium]
MALVFLTLVAPISAEARSATCVRIESQLASLNTFGAGSQSGYGSAIRKQKREIARTKQRMRSYQCTRSGHPSCRRLNNSLKRMTRNLDKLERRYYRSGSRSRSSESQRKRLQRDYRRNNCIQPNRPNQRVASLEKPNFLQRLFGAGNSRRSRQDARKNSGDILDDVFGSHHDAERRRQARLDRRDLRRRQLDQQLWSSANGQGNSNKYRTVCVRRCDGYYFPVSHETDESGFAQDAMACNLMCPGTPMELFSHKTATETPEQMVSTVDGTPYTSIQTAFSHREKFDPQCSCNFKLVKRAYNIDIPDSVRLAKLTNKFFKEKKTALPSWRSDLSAATSPPQPEVASTKSADSTDRHDPRRETPVDERRNRRIRVIGDAFLQSQ